MFAVPRERMNPTLALLGTLKPYKRLIVQTLVASVFYALFSGASIGMMSPLTRALFARVEPGVADTGASGEHAAGREAVAGTDVGLEAGSEASTGPEAAPGQEAGSEVGTGPEAAPGQEAGSEASPASGIDVATEPESKLPEISDLPIVQKLRAQLEAYLFALSPSVALRRVCIAILVVFLLKGVANYLEQVFINRIEQAVMRDLRTRLFSHLTTLSLDFFNRRRAGSLISRLTNDVSLVRGALTAGIFVVTRELLILAVCLFWIFWVSVPLALVSLIVVPAMGLLIVALGKRLRRSSLRTQERMADMTSVIHETIGGMRVVKAFAMERFETGRFRAAADRTVHAFIRLRRYMALSSPLSELLGVGAAVAVLAYGGRLILIERTLTPDRFLLFLVAMLAMTRPLRKLAMVNTDIQDGLAASERIFGLLATRPTVVERAGARPVDRFSSGIRFEGVEFAYEPGRPVLSDIDLEIRAGEVVALVGPSGAGKSTLADLLLRFHDPTRGRITLDGIELPDYRLSDLRRLTGLVTQEVILFNDSVRANIAYGDDSVDEQAIRDAAAAAHAAEFIETLPDGYATEIGDRGVRLSGGQRQRLAIARAILKNPPILVFDEATSALDSESERLVQAAISRLMTGRTALVIAHRLSTVRAADRIVVMDRGRIVEEGSHTDLMRRNGLYTRLHAVEESAPVLGETVG